MAKRDMERMREILFLVEGGDLKEFDAGWMWVRNSSFFQESDNYQIELLEQAGLMENRGRTMGPGCVVSDQLRITFEGHNFLDTVRDEGIWKKTVEAVAASGGNFTLEILKALATGFLKKEIEKHTGMEF